eukprot:COSAG06_NODE_2563_length_6662_cov_16.476459_2_plen_58_part_00
MRAAEKILRARGKKTGCQVSSLLVSQACQSPAFVVVSGFRRSRNKGLLSGREFMQGR